MKSNEWLAQNRFDPEYLPKLTGRLFFEGPRLPRMLTNYVGLLALATAIATFGLMSASTATVIGAMIVAPLMTPIMGTTVALVLGDAARALRSASIVLLSTLFVIALALLLALPFPAAVIDFEHNGELAGRVAPNLLALFAALASGAAGAFAMSREDISDSLPGVAIAISLVPPLAVVGIELANGRWLDAGGAMLLFVTNVLAIILAGGAVFWIGGLRLAAFSEVEASVRRRGFVMAAVATLVVAGMLAASGRAALQQQMVESVVRQVVADWLGPAHYLHVGTTADPVQVTINIAGSGARPPLSELRQRLTARLGYPIGVELHVIHEETEVEGVPPTAAAEP